MLKRWLPILSAFCLGLGLSLLLLLPGGEGLAQATPRQLRLESFAMEADVAGDGSLQISETLTARFDGKWNGLRREIPLLAHRPNGVEPLGLSLISASDPSGRPYRVDSSTAGTNLVWKVYVPNAENASRTVVLRYRVRHGVRFYPNHDELYWNVTGNGWPIPIDRVRALVRLPQGAQGVKASVYTGPAGSQGRDAQLVVGPQLVRATSSRRLEAGEGLTLAVGFAKGLVAEPSLLNRWLDWLQARLALLLPLIAALILGPIWWLIGRDPALGSVPVVYDPPGGLTPAVLGSLVVENVAALSLGATVVDLAVKGHLRIQPLSVLLAWPFQPKRYLFTLRTTPRDWHRLQAHERYLLEHLFPHPVVGQAVDTAALKDTFYVHVGGFERLVREDLIARGFYRSWPKAVQARTLFFGLGSLMVIIWLVSSGMLLSPDIVQLQFQADPQIPILGIGAAALVISLFSLLMPRRTPQGVVVYRHALGFLEFLRRVEAPRYEKVILTPELFERYLPFAMVVGLSRRWSNAFRGILEATPDWYGDRSDHDNSSDRGGSDSSDPGDSCDDFAFDEFCSDIEDCCQTTSSVMQSTPSSSGDSSGGGSSGGGSSGGGDGGGGGGGF